MTADAILVVRVLFTSIWRLFTSWTIPGTNVTPATWAFFALNIVLVLRIAKRFFGSGDMGGDK